MTQEEKVKAYDNALEKARKIKEKIMYSHLSTESCKAVSEYIDTIIPELAESEDERIRKWLWSYFGTIGKNWLFDNEMPLNSILAWLEKQKDINCLACDQHLKGYLAGRKVTEEEKKKEQKPAEWSEEEKEIINHAYCWLDEYGNFLESRNYSKASTIYEIARKLKSLKPQKSNNISITPERLKELRDQSFEDGRKAGIAEMAKSMPMPEDTVLFLNGVKEGRRLEREDMWKPSEEQMEALESAVKLYKDTHFEIHHEKIVSLYEQLKKLM